MATHVGCFARIADLEDALRKIADPRLRDHQESDAYTQLGCVMQIAQDALDGTSGLEKEGLTRLLAKCPACETSNLDIWDLNPSARPGIKAAHCKQCGYYAHPHPYPLKRPDAHVGSEKK